MEERELDRLWLEIRESESRVRGQLERVARDTEALAQDTERRHEENLERFKKIEEWQAEMKGAAKLSRILWIVGAGLVSLGWMVWQFFTGKPSH